MSITKRKNVGFYVIFGLIATLAYSNVNAATNMIFTGTLTVPNCTVNDGNQITVPFNNIEISSLTAKDQAFHDKDFEIKVNCPAMNGTPKIQVTADSHSASNGTIKTNKYTEGLVVYLRKADDLKAIALGQKVDISTNFDTTTSKLKLNAAVGRVKELSDLTPGSFTATSTIEMIYE